MITETSAADVRFAAKETDYTALAAEHVAPCISIYLGSVGAERAAKRWLRLRNILRAAESRLQDFSISLKEAESLLRAAVRAMEGGPRPHSHVQGLAFFTSKDFFSYSSLHESVADRIVVGSEFLATPLLPLVPRDDRFFVLTLSQKQVKLYEGFASGMRERTLQDTPENVREDFGEHGFERQYSFIRPLRTHRGRKALSSTALRSTRRVEPSISCEASLEVSRAHSKASRPRSSWRRWSI
jgi:hypothetical protein